VVLVVDAEVFALLLDTYMPGVVFLFQHGVSPPSVSAIRYHWFPIRTGVGEIDVPAAQD
jgi:hypothetical protein